MKPPPADKSKGNAETGSTPTPAKIDMSMKDAVKTALEKKRPPGGFPKSPSTKHKGGKQ